MAGANHPGTVKILRDIVQFATANLGRFPYFA
jgi:hypothetical protein